MSKKDIENESLITRIVSLRACSCIFINMTNCQRDSWHSRNDIIVYVHIILFTLIYRGNNVIVGALPLRLLASIWL